jgi:hypothetical protein
MKEETINLPEIVKKYIDEVGQKYSKKEIKLVLKSKSKLMKLIGWFFSVTKINPKFLSNYYTTLGSTIYIPDKALSANLFDLLGVIIHECIHIKDHSKYGMLFVISYLFPQILAVFSLFSLLAIWFSKFWLLCLLFLLFLTPLPAWFRYVWEIRAYRTNLLLFLNENDEIKEQIRNWIISQLSKQYYYFTWPFPKFIDNDLKDMSFVNDPEYIEIQDFLKKYNLI